MCGIVGYTGRREAEPILLEGLARLEYRGYDSAGMATHGGTDANAHPHVAGERFDLRQVFATAATVMLRRGGELTETHRDYFYDLFEDTAERRRKTIRDAETRRLQKSV